MFSVHAYPSPADALEGQSLAFEILDGNGAVVLDDYEVCDHPEVPLTQERRDAVLARLQYRRIGPWTQDGASFDAPVEPVGRSGAAASG
ncbi:hypothetical protein ACFC6U_11805 [Kitasatospora purpeofusca]|uniref:hypothetical protein n=1 Tax=Kitasatospora purpeofusca TaxID=67352 RepID=UPI0035D709DA